MTAGLVNEIVPAEEIHIFGERLHSPEARAAMGAFFQKKKG